MTVFQRNRPRAAVRRLDIPVEAQLDPKPAIASECALYRLAQLAQAILHRSLQPMSLAPVQ